MAETRSAPRRTTRGSAASCRGKDFTIFRSEDDEQSRAKFQELLPRGKHALSMTVCYWSVLDDCWATTLDIADEHSEGRPADSCPIPAAERFAE